MEQKRVGSVIHMRILSVIFVLIAFNYAYLHFGFGEGLIIEVFTKAIFWLLMAIGAILMEIVEALAPRANKKNPYKMPEKEA